jgi:signal transduction histidine kinase
VVALGYNATIFTLTDDQTHLAVSHLTFNSALLKSAEKLTGLSLPSYCFPLAPGGFLEQIIDGAKAVFTRDDERPFLDALPELIRPLADRLIDLLGMDQSIIAPLMVDGQAYGLLAVTGSGLSEADVPAVSAFANQAAIAIENAELLTTVTEQRRDLRRLSARLMEAQEKERAHLARELHDEVGQALTAVNINLAEIEKRLGPNVDPLIGKRLGETRALTEQTSERISALALDLRPSLLDDLGLVSTLRWYVSRYSERLGIQVEVEMVDLERRIDPAVETALYRIVQEALTNVARHACATRVRLHLERKVSSVIATIKDNGRGFDPKELTGRHPSERGAGLVGMQERIGLLGGRYHIQSEPGEGTQLSVEIPLRCRDGSRT